MADLTEIKVTYLDNELYIIASQPAFSSELLHLKAGYNAPTGSTVYPPTILPAGTYDLTLVGIDWGGASSFQVTLLFDDNSQQQLSGNAAVGQPWTAYQSVTIVSP